MVFRVPPDGDGRSAYLGELAGLIWPEPAEPALRRGGAGWMVVPSASRPRLLVPTSSGRAAASAVRHSTEAVGRKAKLVRQGLATAFRLGLGPLVFRDRLVVTGGGLDAYLAEVLGERALVSLHIGPARANRKPVLQLLAPDGRALGYAKLGVDPLTRALVDAEAAALARLAGLPLGPVTVAGVCHHGDWHGHALLVQEALPVRLPRATPAAAEAAERAAMVAVAGCLGVRRRSWAASDHATRLADAVDALGARPEAGRLRAVLKTVADLDPTMAFGAWHGDWNGGNSAVLADGRVLVWDWERFEADVPVGYDALHRVVQTAIGNDGVEPTEAARALIAGAGRSLAPFDSDGRDADLVAVLYLVELAARYLRDRQAEAGARLGHVDTWLLPAVEEHLARRAR
ncbi:hypothetical protein RMN56_12305 [Micromonospora halotolerans]|uniref:Aminoglycoside phosphotransferase domain-containing protein n=1 Tax=Micromonospora halotolerans TaxID=709879 RepID=A0ABZ0A3S2_9ACTN|nr:hypothetical protein [Micromonospora halotolerans]WNM42065.1 hypothetical protein RMN56_12305 [Micromonospora halotolerans]